MKRDRGTTVSLYLPRSAAQQRADVLMPASGIVPMGAGEHIVAAEDDPALRHHVKRLVESLGYRVTMAADGSEALAAIRAAGDVTLLFTDVVMPGELPGRLLAEKACAEYPSLRVLFTSGYTENSIVHHGRLDHGVQLLSKPYRRDELARKLRAVLDAPLPTLTGGPVPD
ncbi:response regulator [Gemmobacter fulvus]|uniref:Response regulator n=1 Tax=Gemmobacter fulvus TaxID=2840474 RepID=A0A975P5V2_9RHOB|nr:response regulator [Gemmobacter fulvus]MBT9247817.1 response regulator [Gemmobacter fulvus]QWK89673.1 response regulator [Gemmobacter fulvus]